MLACVDYSNPLVYRRNSSSLSRYEYITAAPAGYPFTVSCYGPVETEFTVALPWHFPFQANLENVTDLKPVDEQSYTYFVKVQCTSCREEHPNVVGISREVSQHHESN